MTPADNKRLIQRFVEECINRQNLAALDELVAEDFVEQVPFPGQGPGRAGLRDALRVFLAAFPDQRWTIDEQIAEGEKVASRFTFTATHGGDFFGMPATRKRVEVWGVVIDVVRNGKMAESRIILDMAGLMRQING